MSTLKLYFMGPKIKVPKFLKRSRSDKSGCFNMSVCPCPLFIVPDLTKFRFSKKPTRTTTTTEEVANDDNSHEHPVNEATSYTVSTPRISFALLKKQEKKAKITQYPELPVRNESIEAKVFYIYL